MSIRRAIRLRIGIAAVLIAASLVLALAVPALPSASAQGTTACPIQIVMQDMLFLRAGPAWNTQVTTTLQAGNVVCLIGRDAATTWLQVGTSNVAPLGWAPVNAFWATVPFTVLPVTSGVVTPPPPPPTVTPVPPPTGQTYVVQWGDTLFGIARRFGVNITLLAQANNIAPNSWVYAGQVLVIPGTNVPPTQPPPNYRTYVVQRGDYLVSIAAQYGLHWRQLAQLNNILPPYVIYPGQTLLIP